MVSRIDEIDKRILYYLAKDARNTAAPEIADEMEVTPATIRNRIRQLEEEGVLRGYLADIDYKSIEGHVTYQFSCTAPIPERDRLAQAALEVSGVVTVRELMTGNANLAITAVGSDTNDIGRIAGELSDIGLDIEDESVIEKEYHRPYDPFGPEDAPKGPSLTDFMGLAGGAEVVEFTVSEGAEVAGLTIEEAVDEGLLADEMLVVGVERDGDVITPKGETVIEAGDVISLFSKTGLEKDALEVFGTR
ncbi:Lrp/AsnC family transcriptional regulator [Halapricum hydrolyticum]|uniref:Winged helix-turn-helix transcriptional regulator n=1 Tax=Halapricum hydrolyticum TaxID=2979991 RepID=A0AAE3I8T6_9EURY|nr:winged helix-turn-helix transcriptional regulator [Halapricum hydrolyticum]MCU4716502.1 winged helix-turn-helix transcriptional regulator [Halapricum hydrolyticum]MCU4725893.1 winged helix-turn-helix transcriptional regulator [Halapricum hydrolyticum]